MLFCHHTPSLFNDIGSTCKQPSVFSYCWHQSLMIVDPLKLINDILRILTYQHDFRVHWTHLVGPDWDLVGPRGALGGQGTPRDAAWFSVIFRDFSISIYFSLSKTGPFVGTAWRRVILRDFPWPSVTAWKSPWWAMNGTFLGRMTPDIYN